MNNHLLDHHHHKPFFNRDAITNSILGLDPYALIVIDKNDDQSTYKIQSQHPFRELLNCFKGSKVLRLEDYRAHALIKIRNA